MAQKAKAILRPAIISERVEVDDVEGFIEYLMHYKIRGYRDDCMCYGCNANRKFFIEHWKSVDRNDPL